MAGPRPCAASPLSDVSATWSTSRSWSRSSWTPPRRSRRTCQREAAKTRQARKRKGQMLTGQTIKTLHADVFTFLRGNLQTRASHCEIPEDALRGSLVYASTPEQATEALLHDPAILI